MLALHSFFELANLCPDTIDAAEVIVAQGLCHIGNETTWPSDSSATLASRDKPGQRGITRRSLVANDRNGNGACGSRTASALSGLPWTGVPQRRSQ